MPPRRDPVNFDQFADEDSGFVTSEPDDSSEDEIADIAEFQLQNFVDVPARVDLEEQADGGQPVNQIQEAPPDFPVQLAEIDQGNFTKHNDKY